MIALTLITITIVLLLLAFTKLSSDAVLLGSLIVLLLSGILTPKEAFSGFISEGVLTIAYFLIVASGLKQTGSVQFLAQKLFKKQKNIRRILVNLIIPVSAISGFMNNTAVVTMLIPAVQEWSKRIQLSSSKLLIPLSYSSIMGGTLTLIGTSTNVVVAGLLKENYGIQLSIFEITNLDLMILIVGSLYLFFFWT